MAKRKAAAIEETLDSDIYEIEGPFMVVNNPPRKLKKVRMYEVEVILAARLDQCSQYEYYVKWYGYHDSQNTWEPHDSVKNCIRLLRSFWASIPYDDTLLPVNHVVRPSQEWIQSEKAYYRNVVRNAHVRMGMSKRKKSEIVLREQKRFKHGP